MEPTVRHRRRPRHTGAGILALCGLALGAFACARTQMPTATAADAGRAARRWPGTTLADLHRGRELYIARCSSCHQPVAPGSIAARDWPGHVREMQERANLEPGPAELVVRYLVTMSAARNR